MPDVTVSVSVTLASASVFVGGSVQAVARVVTDVSDNALDPKAVVWSSLTPTVATVDPVSGLVRAIAPGSAVIRAAVGAVAGSATLTVTAQTIAIDAAQEAAIMAVPKGGQFVLRGPTSAIDCVVS